MRYKEKTYATVINHKLIEAFADSRFEAFSKLRSCKWTREHVDVFANEMRRMARESGLTGEGLEKVVNLTFVKGFPDHISLELQQIQGIELMKLNEILGKARVLANKPVR
ncbi:hypothetical protein ElyMa_004598300 [Elysia marginata]|uniref:Uncharacterized protein n=1 Tax=Elysia marginata TaxID=1093978 RepID=A0AAV4HYZ5_9GAST|nr:hypothetical protein ElyMa_004598300 [Elysia marginata]